MNKSLHRSKIAWAGGLMCCLVVGCAGGPSGRSTTGPFSEQSLAQRRASAAETPIAQTQSANRKNDESQRSLAPVVSLASFATAAAAAPPDSEPESSWVPREPMGLQQPNIDPTAPATHSPYALAGHRRPLAGGHAHGPDGQCAHCAGGQRYAPVFPQMNTNGYSPCGPSSEAACGPDCGPECGPAARCMDPQEYIFDGGDRGAAVRVRDDMSQAGLDPEDTVIQFTTQDGQTHVQSGCRVAIYAPRFGSVRKRTGTLTADLALRPQASMVPDGPGVLREQLPPVNLMKPVGANRKDSVRVVEAFRERQAPLPSDRVIPMGVLSDAYQAYEDLEILRNGNLLATDPAKLAMATAAARIWTNVDQLKVIVDGQDAALITDLKQSQEVALYEFKGARIRLCKVASEQMANPGDIISFTIRFDNVGEQPLKNLVVTDSLAPRLEYVDATQQSSLGASFTTTPNEAGSVILRWEFEKEIKPGDGGLVRFDTKVR